MVTRIISQNKERGLCRPVLLMLVVEVQDDPDHTIGIDRIVRNHTELTDIGVIKGQDNSNVKGYAASSNFPGETPPIAVCGRSLLHVQSHCVASS